MFHGISMGNYCQLPWNCGILRHLEREPTSAREWMMRQLDAKMRLR